MEFLIKGGLVYTVTSSPIKNGAIAVDDGRITAVGPAADFVGGEFGETIDLPGQILMPGFVNSHSHLQFSSLKGKIPRGLGFVEWIRRLMAAYRAETSEDILKGIRDGISEMISSGVTAAGDVSNDPKFAKIVAGSGLNAVCFAEVIAPLGKDADDAFRTAKARVEEMSANGINPGISPHAPYTVSESLFKLLNRFASENAVPFATHLAESVEEDKFIREGSGEMGDLLAERGFERKTAGGCSPVGLLDRYGVLKGTTAVHLNHVDDQDIEILIKNGVVPIFCPGSSEWFGRRKVPPLDRMMTAGMRPALGTDSLASNYSLSMLDELRTAEKYFPSIKREEWARCATLNGALALGLNAGCVEKGKRADIISFKGADAADPLGPVFEAQKPEFMMMNGRRIFGTEV